MNKKDRIVREILGWKEHGKNCWYDVEKDAFVHESYFLPEKFMEHAMVIVKKLEMFGVKYRTNGVSIVCFDNAVGTGATLPEAITDAAYALIEDYYSVAENRS
ncbi:BC1872 family protein [Niallia endozanthoxylica]|uniref:Phage ABA sandwich domain-containing protein n=1 Tax=Niallia endozanthoxylica TaxID=2036016 RepID=A0A5J5I2N2_9BACI|nr:hypothetical protein [Niallia endozanthoxylica]KAA9029921.1 hypothetical protein F4V44_02645 [Niallia endozanthoxylica]